MASNKLHQHSPISFFKIITATSIESGKLRIPKKFTRTHGDDLSNPIFLKAPNGTEWKICHSKLDGDIWFQDGWKDFATYYSLDRGHVMVFKYKDASHFGVRIYDTSTVEIAYPSNENQGEEHNPPPKKNKLKSPMSRSQPRKKLRTCTSKDVGETLELTKDDAGGRTECLEGEQLTSAITNALKKANGATCVIDLKPYSIEKHSLSIPSPFARQHLKNKTDIRLEVLDGRTWKVNYNLFKFSGGWHKFAEDNNLEVGDVCVFELTKRKPLTLKVLIFPLAQGGEASTSRRAPKLNIPPHLRNAALMEAQKFIPKNPHFTIHLKPDMDHCYRPHVPIAFIRDYLNENKQTIKLKFEKRSWPVELLSYPIHGAGKLSKGWTLFAKECNLEGGDVCVFELIKKKVPVLQLHIFKGH